MLPLVFGSNDATSSSSEIHEGNIWFRSIAILSGKNTSHFSSHLTKYAVKNAEMATTLWEDLYVDVFLGRAETIEQTRQYKQAGIVVFGDATFELRKWHWNIRELDGGDQSKYGSRKTFWITNNSQIIAER